MKKFLLILVSLVLLVSLCSCAEVIDGILCDILGVTNSHVHSFGEWETKTAADCENAEVEVRKCECGEEELRPGDAALGHTIVSISAVCTKEDYMQGDVASASDFQVTANCECGASLEVTDEVTLENATLANEGENTVTVNCGEFSTIVVVNASKFVLVLNGSLVEDTYVSADKKNDNYIERETMGTNSSTFRVFLKFNFSNILSNEQFLADTDNAKVQFSFTIVEGAYTETSTFTFGGYIPGEGVSDIDFASITWNAIRNTAFDWANAVYPIDQAVGSHHVSYTDNLLTLTFTYGQIKDFIDADGNAIFTFRAQQSGVKISSKEGVAAPSVKVIVDDSHLHAFDQRIESEQYFISANCEEATYYYKSCRCGEHGDDYFKTETINEHVFGEWDVITPATCTEDGVKARHCTLCEDGVENEIITAIGHIADSVWSNDESFHWNNCVNCEEKLNSSAHSGGTATEEEKATCETCGVKYGEVSTHVHDYSASVTAPDCENAGFTTYTCRCGSVYTANEVAALGHDMQTKFDADYHWTECANNCGNSTGAVAHFGGTATETEKATCEGCGQQYGELKAEEKEVTVNGTIKQDTYINSSSSNNMSSKDSMGTYSNSFKIYLQFNLSKFLENATEADKANAKVQFSFAITEGSVTDTSKFTLKSFATSELISGIDFSKDTLTWNNVKSGNDYYALNWNDNGQKLIEGTQAANIVVENGMIHITVDFSAIESYIDANGNILIAFATNTSGLKIASMENTTFAKPAVSVTYTK